MSLQTASFPTPPFLKIRISSKPNFRPRCGAELGCHTGDFAGIVHNKVLVAATVSAAIGQISKPFTSMVLYGKKFDLRAAFRAGGFPSTHSSAAVATATSLALERGFSDPIFGLAAVYASLIMYDAQGVRREVGVHAKELNKVILRSRINPPSSRKDTDDLVESFSRELLDQNSFQTNPKFSSQLPNSDDRKQNFTPYINSYSTSSPPEKVSYSYSLLKESIGHTEVEVTAGALLGLLVSLAVCPYV